MKPNIGISDDKRAQVCTHLNRLLADEYVLYTKTLNYHWNVKGMMFNDLHLFFERQYKELFDIVDQVAERVTTLGGNALGTMHAFLEHASLQESINAKSEKDMLLQLLNNHEQIIRLLRELIDSTATIYHDMGTSNFVTDVLERHEKMAWMLRSYVS